MSLYSKANLAVRDLASTDRKDPGLRRVQFDPDGTTVASNGRALIAVSPPEPRRAERFPRVEEDHAEPPAEGVGITPESVGKIAQLIPRGSQESLHYAQMTRCDEREVELMGTDGYRKEKIACVPCRGQFPEWRKPLREAMHAANTGRVCVDRLSLMRALQALEKACPDPGNNNPVFIEFGESGDSLVLRSVNYVLAQRAVAMVKPMLVKDGQWLESDEWERSIRDEEDEEVRNVRDVRAACQHVPRTPDDTTKAPRRLVRRTPSARTEQD